MRRDARLIQLSREHFTALKLAKSLKMPADQAVPAHLAALVKAALPELMAHFMEEETDLMPQLRSYGADDLVDRVLDEHRQLRELSSDLHNPVALNQFGLLLTAHVRFEEREVFEALQKFWQ